MTEEMQREFVEFFETQLSVKNINSVVDDLKFLDGTRGVVTLKSHHKEALDGIKGALDNVMGLLLIGSESPVITQALTLMLLVFYRNKWQSADVATKLIGEFHESHNKRST